MGMLVSVDETTADLVLHLKASDRGFSRGMFLPSMSNLS